MDTQFNETYGSNKDSLKQDFKESEKKDVNKNPADDLGKMASEAYEKVSETAQDVQGKVKENMEPALNYIYDNPVKAVCISAAAGMLLGLLLKNHS